VAITNPNEGVYEHSEFAGLRNVVPAERLGLEDLVVATNVDIDDSLEISLRPGFSAPVVSGDIRSLFVGTGMCLASRNGTDLIRVFPDFTFDTLRTDLIPLRDISYTVLGNYVGWSNGLQTGVVQAGEARTWGLATPMAQGNAASMGGTLRAGRYQYAVTFIRNDGQQSGTPRAEGFEVTEGGMALTDLPVSYDPSVFAKLVWATDTNSETLYHAGTIPNAQTTFNLVAPVKQTVVLSTQFFGPPPAGQIVRAFNGRSLVASGSVLFYSEPLAYELFDLRKNYPFAGDITLVEPMNDGVYLSTSDALFWLSGSIPEKWEFNDALSYGAILGTTDYCTADMISDGKGNGPVAVFTTTQGICVARDGGQITNITQDRFTIPSAAKGAGMIRRHKGTVQYVAALRD